MSGFNIGAVVAHIKADISDFQRNIAKVQADTATFSGKLTKLGKAGVLAFAALGAAAGAAGIKIIKSSIDQAAAYEQTQVAFTTMLGDAKRAKDLLDEIAETAKKTPFQLPELEEGAKRLLAYGTAADDLVPTLKMLGDVTAGLGTEKMPQLILAFGQIQAKGRLMGTELRQLTETGFNLAEAMGITNGELEEMVSNGQVSFEDVKQAFMSATSEGGKFFNLMENQSQTFSGQVSNLKDTLTLLAREIGLELLPVAKLIVAWMQESFVPALREAINWLKAHKEEIKTAFEVMWTVIKVTWEVVSFILKALVVAFKFAGETINATITALINIFYYFRGIWLDTVLAVKAAIANLIKVFTELKDMVENAMKAVFTSITGWLTKAWDKAKEIADKIRHAISEAFNTEKKNSPSIRERLQQVVDLSNDMLSDVKVPSYSHDISQSLAGVGAGTAVPGITISLDGAIIADELGAARMAELLGDQIIKKLKQNVRF